MTPKRAARPHHRLGDRTLRRRSSSDSSAVWANLEWLWAGVDEDAVRAVMAAVVGKAAAGDLRAAELLLKVIGPGKAG